MPISSGNDGDVISHTACEPSFQIIRGDTMPTRKWILILGLLALGLAAFSTPFSQPASARLGGVTITALFKHDDTDVKPGSGICSSTSYGYPICTLRAAPNLESTSATIIVNTTADEYDTGAGCSLREALRAANSDEAFGGCPAGSGADTVQLAGGVYMISPSQAEFFRVESDITIQGVGAANTIIDGNHLRTALFLASGPVKLKQLAIRNAKGSGVYIQGSGMAVTLDEIEIYNNVVEAGNGGGIYNMGLLTINKSRIYGNTASAAGGGIVNNGSLTINNSMISDNTASVGGGLYNTPARGATINGSTINGNRATNAANVSKNGGGIYNSNGSLNLVNSTLSGNMADGYGGGLYNSGGVSLHNVTITENIADNDENNSGTGGGVYNTYTVSLQNTILARNYNAEVVGTSVDNCYGSQISSEGYNLFGTLNCSVGGDITGNMTGNPLLTALGNYGGFTSMHALKPGSPAIDAGDPAGCKNSNGIFIYRDQRGVLRPLDGDNDGSVRCDIGAYEFVFEYKIYLPIIVR
jgi:CSLREA domain-containing protein